MCFLGVTPFFSLLAPEKQQVYDISHYSLEEAFFVVQLLSCVWLFEIPWTAARQSSLSIINSQSLLKLMSIELVMPSNYLVLCCPLLLLPSISPSIRVFCNELALLIRWPKYWSFSFSIHPNSLEGINFFLPVISDLLPSLPRIEGNWLLGSLRLAKEKCQDRLLETRFSQKSCFMRCQISLYH